jgi:glycosyltransferase involved in cell wall biosynthesis
MTPAFRSHDSVRSNHHGTLEVALLTGGTDRPYALGLADALLSKGVRLDFIGSDDLDCPALRKKPLCNFLNLRGDQREDASLAAKVTRVLGYYARLVRYALRSRPPVFHILWHNKFEAFDRTLLMLFYKLLGKKIAFTAHNVNAGKRDAKDTLLNRLTLRFQYRLADHVFVHTQAMKKELVEGFDIGEDVATVIPFGLTAAVPDTDLTRGQARQRLGLGERDKAILFYGHIAPYKGLAFLVAAFQQLAANDADYRLIVAGKPSAESEAYVNDIQQSIANDAIRARITQRLEFVPENETEIYFKAADVLALPYTEISQSGVLVLGYSFGLPAIAADVGSFRDDIVEGDTGFLCRPGDHADLARAIDAYFRSDLFRTLATRRPEIRQYAERRYSWDAVSRATCAVYQELLAK